MSLRRFARDLVINLSTALRRDAAVRADERCEIRAGAGPIVRVLYLHGTPRAHADRLRRRLAWLRDEFDVLDFAGFTQLFDGSRDAAPDRPSLLLTFDDGFRSNYEVAAPILEELGMRGVFFVVPAFSLASGDEARRLYRERVLARPTAGFEPPMTPEHIGELAARGHTIGNHTFTHAALSHTPAADYPREILDSADLIESWIGRPVDAFAWPFVWDAITPEAHRLARGRHRFCFTPCSGRVDVRRDAPGLIWRTNAEIDRREAEFRFQCSALADRTTAARRRDLLRRLGTASAAAAAA